MYPVGKHIRVSALVALTVCGFACLSAGTALAETWKLTGPPAFYSTAPDGSISQPGMSWKSVDGSGGRSALVTTTLNSRTATSAAFTTTHEFNGTGSISYSWDSPPEVLHTGDVVAFNIRWNIGQKYHDWCPAMGTVVHLDWSEDWYTRQWYGHSPYPVSPASGQVSNTVITVTSNNATQLLFTVATRSSDSAADVHVQWTYGLVAAADKAAVDKAAKAAADKAAADKAATTPTAGGGGGSGQTSSGWVEILEPVKAQRMTIQVGRRQVPVGGTVGVPVYLVRSEGVANMNFEIRYDAAVAVLAGDASKGPFLGNAFFVANGKTPGLIRGAFAATTGLSGTGVIATIPFRAVGSSGKRSPLPVTVTTINNASGASLTIERVDGLVQIAGGIGGGGGPGGGPSTGGGTGGKPPGGGTGGLPGTGTKGGEPAGWGDCNGDGRITEVDALCALKISVGLMPPNPTAYTSLDAAKILRKAVGKV
jgi:Cohesin domain